MFYSPGYETYCMPDDSLGLSLQKSKIMVLQLSMCPTHLFGAKPQSDAIAREPEKERDNFENDNDELVYRRQRCIILTISKDSYRAAWELSETTHLAYTRETADIRTALIEAKEKLSTLQKRGSLKGQDLHIQDLEKDKKKLIDLLSEQKKELTSVMAVKSRQLDQLHRVTKSMHDLKAFIQQKEIATMELTEEKTTLIEEMRTLKDSSADEVERLTTEKDDAVKEFNDEKELSEQLAVEFETTKVSLEKQLDVAISAKNGVLLQLNTALRTLDKNSTRLNSQTEEIEQLKSTHVTEIQRLVEEHSQEIEELKEEHNTEIENLESDVQHASETTSQSDGIHEEQIDQLNQDHAEQITGLKKRHETQIAELKKLHETEIVALKQKHEADEADEQTRREEAEISQENQHLTDLALMLDIHEKFISEANENEKLRVEMRELQESQEAARNELESSHMTAINELKDLHTTALNELINSHTAALREFESSHEASEVDEMNELTEEHALEIKELAEKHALEIQGLVEKHALEIKENDEKHAEAVARLEADSGGTDTLLEGKIVEIKRLTDKIEELEGKIVETKKLTDKIDELEGKIVELETVAVARSEADSEGTDTLLRDEVAKLKEILKGYLHDTSMIMSNYIDNTTLYISELEYVMCREKRDDVRTPLEALVQLQKGVREGVEEYVKGDKISRIEQFPAIVQTIKENSSTLQTSLTSILQLLPTTDDLLARRLKIQGIIQSNKKRGTSDNFMSLSSVVTSSDILFYSDLRYTSNTSKTLQQCYDLHRLHISRKPSGLGLRWSPTVVNLLNVGCDRTV